MNIENTQAQMRKGILEYCILLMIAREDCYVQDIINKLKASKMLVVEGTIIPFDDPSEKYGFTFLPLARIHPRPSQEIL